MLMLLFFAVGRASFICCAAACAFTITHFIYHLDNSLVWFVSIVCGNFFFPQRGTLRCGLETQLKCTAHNVHRVYVKAPLRQLILPQEDVSALSRRLCWECSPASQRSGVNLLCL